MHELLTCEEMAQADRRAVALGVSSLTLMENAGRATADEAGKMVRAGARIAVLCGPGNNGGDGFVAARYLKERGFEVRLSSLVPVDQLKGDAAEMARRCPVKPRPVAVDATQAIDLIIDAVFGAGLSRPLRGEEAEFVLAINAAGKVVLSVDIPSGLNGTTGADGGCSVRATRTITFFRRKPGHLLMPGRTLCGHVVVSDIGIPEAVLDTSHTPHSGPLSRSTGSGLGGIAISAFENHPASWLAHFPWPRLDAHKYARGHALVLSGPAFRTGAARLAARGALRIGAGLVTVASPASALLENAAHLTAIMLKRCDDARALDGILSDRRMNAVLVGPGAGVGAETRAFTESALKSGAAVVLDADALTSFAQPNRDGEEGVVAGFGFTAAAVKQVSCPDDLFAAIKGLPERATVLTPHEGEFARLFPNIAALGSSKLEQARAAAKASGSTIVLKGPDTVVAAPDGRAAINANAPPWLATAGSGDALAGFICGLLAQGLPAFEAACAAAWLHGDCANTFGIGLIAEDLPEVLPNVLQKLSDPAKD